MRSKKYLTIAVITLIIILSYSLFLNYQYNKQKNFYKQSVPYLLPGEKITYFDLVGLDGDNIDASILEQEKPSLIIIFKQPCSSCNENIQLWRRLGKLVTNRVNVYGIILNDDVDPVEFSKKTRLSFGLYQPFEKEKFVENWRVKLKYAQTIIYHQGRVIDVKLGDLSSDEFTEIIKILKEEIQT